MWEEAVKAKPMSVMMLGASHSGNQVTHFEYHGLVM